MHVLSISIILFFRIVVCLQELWAWFISKWSWIDPPVCVYRLMSLSHLFFLILLARFSYSLTESKRLINIQCSQTSKKLSSRDRADRDCSVHSTFITMKGSPSAKNAEFFCYGRVLLLYFSSKTPNWALHSHFATKDPHDNLEGYNFCL